MPQGLLDTSFISQAPPHSQSARGYEWRNPGRCPGSTFQWRFSSLEPLIYQTKQENSSFETSISLSLLQWPWVQTLGTQQVTWAAAARLLWYKPLLLSLAYCSSGARTGARKLRRLQPDPQGKPTAGGSQQWGSNTKVQKILTVLPHTLQNMITAVRRSLP